MLNEVSDSGNKLTNLITRQALFEGGDYKTFSDNGGGLTTNGIEVTLQSQPLKNLQCELSLTYQKTEDEQLGGNDPAFSPTILGYLKLAYRVSDDIDFSLSGYYVGEMSSFFDVELKNPSAGAGSEQIGYVGKDADGYFVLGANFRMENLFSDGLYVNINVSNLLDETIRHPTTSLNKWADKGTIGEERMFFVTVGYEF